MEYKDKIEVSNLENVDNCEKEKKENSIDVAK
jgi:hypothetical protein